MRTNNRTCAVTKRSLPKTDLVRVVKTKDNEFLVGSNVLGRGLYFGKDLTLTQISKIHKQKLLHKAFRFNVPDETYKQLEAKLTEGQEVKSD